MANVQQAITFVINLEDDRKYPGCITQLAGDTGGKTRLGVTEKFHPELIASGFFDGDPIPGSSNPLRWNPTTVSKTAALTIASQIYAKQYAAPMRIDQINSQDVANRLLSFAVNQGTRQAVLNLQRVLPDLVADGSLGPATLAAINAADPDKLIASLQQENGAFYNRLATNDPNSAAARYKAGLENRAEA